MTIEQIARICHDANASLCHSVGDHSQTSWGEAPEWQRESAIKGVQFHLANPDASASATHDIWLKEKAETGWVYGESKDAAAKTHPCIVPFEQLPPEQQAKDHLFRGIVHALAGFVA
ncbi:MAG TPA: RyR domain-containing protein [Pyrinomonadaceae bacterium]